MGFMYHTVQSKNIRFDFSKEKDCLRYGLVAACAKR